MPGINFPFSSELKRGTWNENEAQNACPRVPRESLCVRVSNRHTQTLSSGIKRKEKSEKEEEEKKEEVTWPFSKKVLNMDTRQSKEKQSKSPQRSLEKSRTGKTSHHSHSLLMLIAHWRWRRVRVRVATEMITSYSPMPFAICQLPAHVKPLKSWIKPEINDICSELNAVRPFDT